MKKTGGDLDCCELEKSDRSMVNKVFCLKVVSVEFLYTEPEDLWSLAPAVT